MITLDPDRDITGQSFEAAILDQIVAGAFHDKRYAYVAVLNHNAVDDDSIWMLGIAIENERGYSPIKGKTFATKDEADAWADGLNKHIGHTDDDALHIVVSSMRGRAPRRGT